jgi:dolichyl-phosphate beta-glucosyltransferase
MPSKRQSNTRPELSIVIPAYSEEKRIGQTLDKLAKYLNTEKMFKGKNVEVIVVSADSRDRTHAIVISKTKSFKKLTLLRPGERVGKGRDVQYGMLRAKGQAIIFMDADLATPLKYLAVFYLAFLKGSDVVIATRNLLKHHPNYLRRLLSNSGNLLFRFASGVWIEDSQCGFKLFSYKAAQTCFKKMTILGWGFDMEILAIAKANKLKMTSYRVNDWTSVPGGTFNDGILKNSMISLLELVYLLRNRLSKRYIN